MQFRQNLLGLRCDLASYAGVDRVLLIPQHGTRQVSSIVHNAIPNCVGDTASNPSTPCSQPLLKPRIACPQGTVKQVLRAQIRDLCRGGREHAVNGVLLHTLGCKIVSYGGFKFLVLGSGLVSGKSCKVGTVEVGAMKTDTRSFASEPLGTASSKNERACAVAEVLTEYVGVKPGEQFAYLDGLQDVPTIR